ncbi:MAG: hypothetical protein ABI649_03030 [Gaiellaceae bacterium]
MSDMDYGEEKRTARLVSVVRGWSAALSFFAVGLGVGLPLSLWFINAVYGLPEHIVWFCETTRLDTWLFWIINATGEVNETPWWW